MQWGMALRTTHLVRRVRPLTCSFCGRSEADVRQLAAGARAFICDECVAACGKVFDQSKAAVSDSQQRRD